MASHTSTMQSALSGALASAAAGEGTLSLRVVVRTPTVETFVQKYSRFVKEDRIFIFTKSSQPPGTKLRFTLELVDGKPLLSGEGTVTRVRSDSTDPTRPPGMELRFVPIDDASQKIVGLLLAERETLSRPPTQTRAVPVPPSASLPVLPHTGRQAAYDPPEPASEPAAPTQEYPPLLPRGATPAGKESPLLRGSIVGQRTDLPRRPGAGRPTLIGVAPTPQVPAPNVLVPAESPSSPEAATPTPEPPPQVLSPLVSAAVTSVASPPTTPVNVTSPPLNVLSPPPKAPVVAPPVPSGPPLPAALADAPRKLSPPPEQRSLALARTLALEAPTLPAKDAPSPDDVKTELLQPLPGAAVTTGVAGDEAPLPDAQTTITTVASVARPSEQGAPSAASSLDTGSLFTGNDSAHPPADTSEETQVDVSPKAAIDEISASFPVHGEAPAFAESWKAPGDEHSGLNMIPANPFSEVSDGAIEYFVEWSLERSTAPPEKGDQEATSFGAVKMKPPPSPEDDLPQKRRGGMMGLVIGLGAGLLIGGVGHFVLRARPASTVTESTVAATKAVEPSKPAAVENTATPAPAPVAEKPNPVAEKPAPVAEKPAPVAAKPSTAGAVGAGKLEITSQPPGATAYLDGNEQGQTPVTIDLPSGRHEVAVKLDRYVPFTATATGPGTLEAVLKRPRAILRVTSNPLGADVVVDGEKHGKTPANVSLPAYESYNVEVTFGPGRVWKRRVYVKTPLTAVQAGSVAVRASPLASPFAKPQPRK